MRVGVLGLGFMGSTHVNAVATIPGAELGAVMDADETRLSGDLSGIQGNLGGPGQKLDFSSVNRYRTIEEILGDRAVEAVDICLPTNFHAPVAVQALRAGKHVLVEKPMALDGKAADEMTSEAAKANRVLMTAHVLRFHDAYRGLSEVVKSGRLGQIRSAIFRRRTSVPTWGPWEFDSSKSGGGVFDLLIHDVDMCLHLFGVPESVRASGHENMAGGVDAILAEFVYPGTGFVAVTGGWHHTGEYPFSMEYTVIGDGGVVEFSSAGRPAAVYWKDGKKEVLKDTGADCYRSEIEYFVECCRNGRRPEVCMPEESARAVKLTRLMVEARQRQGERVPCEI